MPSRLTHGLTYTPLATSALLVVGLTAFTGCGPNDAEKEAALERGREVMAELQEDIIEEKSGAVAEALRDQAMGEMGRGGGDQFMFREPGRDLSRESFVRTVVEQGVSQADAEVGWEQQAEAVRADWMQNFGQQSGQSADRLAMLWSEGRVPPVAGVAMPGAAWPSDESGEAMSRRITVGMLQRYGFSEAFSTGQWEQHRDENRQQFIDIVKEHTGASDERAAELWDGPRR